MKYPDIKTITCFGAGLIGSGWATEFAMKGFRVKVYDVVPDMLKDAQKHVAHNFQTLIQGDVLSEEEALAAKKRIDFVPDVKEALQDVQFVQEATSERLEVKKQVLETIDTYCDENVIVGSSTSSLLVSQLAPLSKYPQRVICCHPYNPPYLIPLVELVGTEGSEDAVAHIEQMLRSMKKEPVVLKKEAKGYIANRLQVVIGREIVEMVYRGICTVEDAETALTFGPGIRWAIFGHNLTMQLGGGDGGVKAMFDKVVVRGAEKSSYLDDLGNWIKYPDDWPEVAQEGIDETLSHRSREIGNDNESLADYRDQMLIGILKLHHKL